MTLMRILGHGPVRKLVHDSVSADGQPVMVCVFSLQVDGDGLG